MKTGFQNVQTLKKNAISRFGFDDLICGPVAAIRKKLL